MDYIKLFCYVVCIDYGFYMESDIRVERVFLEYKSAKKYLSEMVRKTNKSGFIVKKRFYL